MFMEPAPNVKIGAKLTAKVTFWSGRLIKDTDSPKRRESSVQYDRNTEMSKQKGRSSDLYPGMPAKFDGAESTIEEWEIIKLMPKKKFFKLRLHGKGPDGDTDQPPYEFKQYQATLQIRLSKDMQFKAAKIPFDFRCSVGPLAGLLDLFLKLPHPPPPPTPCVHVSLIFHLLPPNPVSFLLQPPPPRRPLTALCTVHSRSSCRSF